MRWPPPWMDLKRHTDRGPGPAIFRPPAFSLEAPTY